MNPFRFFGLIIFIIIEIIASFSGGRRRYGMRRINYWGMYEDAYESNPSRGLGAVIRCKIRRGRALKKCSKYCSKAKYVITLKNSRVRIIFDGKNKTLTLFDNTAKDRFATVVWGEQSESFMNNNDNIFEQTFDNICFSFTDKASYSGILKVLRDNFTEIQETRPPSPKPKTTNTDDSPIKLNIDNYVDINTATAEQIATLPGINIILAKRIVQYRDLKGSIKSRNELFQVFNIKKHFQDEIKKLVIFSNHRRMDESYDAINKNILKDSIKNTKKNDNDDKGGDGERIVDF